MCQRDCPISDVVTSTDSATRYEKVFNCMVNSVVMAHNLAVCSPTCCAVMCQSSSNCNAFFAGKYKVGVGAIPGVCQACPSNSDTAAEASGSPTDCKCNSKYTGNDGENCDACVPGKYKSDVGSSACENCIAGTYSTTSSAVTPLACLSCPLNSDAAEASDSPADCICNAGFSGMHGGPCT